MLLVKNLPANTGDIRDVGLIPGSGRFPWKRKWQPTPVFVPGESHGQRSLVGYNPWGCKESDMTDRLSTHVYEVMNILIDYSNHFTVCANIFITHI